MSTSRKTGHLTRRQFVAAGALGSAAIATGCAPGKQGNWEQIQAMSRKRFGQDLELLSQPQQLAIVSELSEQDRTFFELVRDHTMEGYYGSPRHGGNRDAVSWRMLGLPEPPPLGRSQYDLGKGSPS